MYKTKFLFSGNTDENEPYIELDLNFMPQLGMCIEFDKEIQKVYDDSLNIFIKKNPRFKGDFDHMLDYDENEVLRYFIDSVFKFYVNHIIVNISNIDTNVIVLLKPQNIIEWDTTH